MERDGVFMFRRKAVIIVIVAMLMSITYIFAIDEYDTQSTKLGWLSERLSIGSIEYEEIGVELEGIVYNESLELKDIQGKLEELAKELSHNKTCSKLCKMFHLEDGKYRVERIQQVKKGSLEASDQDWKYVLNIQNQKDVHDNTYYHLNIVGTKDIETLDMLRSRGYDKLKSWKVDSKETIYFKGFIKGELTKEEETAIKETLLQNLEAKQTNYYVDDVSGTTCAYYGYTHHIKAYVKEEDGQKTNVQISFNTDEANQRINIIIAFPFYNEPF